MTRRAFLLSPAVLLETPRGKVARLGTDLDKRLHEWAAAWNAMNPADTLDVKEALTFDRLEKTFRELLRARREWLRPRF